ncbi:MAG TPA: HAMP domain-containing sensor histidine kinase [Myxococcales bacterium]
MRLRARLLLTTIAVSLPLVFALGALQAHLDEHAREDSITQFALLSMQNGGRERCEAAPERFSLGPPHGPEHQGHEPPPHFGHPHPDVRLFAYDDSFSSRNPEAPRLDERLVAPLRAGQARSSRLIALADGRTFEEALLRMPWAGGPCAVVLARHPHPGAPPLHLPPLQFFLLPLAATLAGLLIAVGPLVRRIQKLTREVRASAQSKYEPAITVRGKDEVGDLARAFVEAGGQIRAQMSLQEERERTLRDFLDNTTHDVMIPLTVLQGHLASMAEARGAPDAAAVDAAMSEAHYMASLIHNLGVAARIEAGEPSAKNEPLNLNEIVQRAVARHQPLARRGSVLLEFAVPEPPVWTRGDVTLAEQAVSNIVFNAVRYNRTGGHVAVTLEHAGARFVVRVVDDGPGIPAGERSRLMERHSRGNAARTRAPDGRGLGLNIALQVASLHSWDLRLNDSAYGGLQVEIEGPICATMV